ncbi:MAG: hypothetical protein JW731_10030 [Bacteroidales bacterium]|nr:hypothetical protein [Bacteroidales bacterium]
MAFVILWIVAGSLVEFHQRYVFHKQVDLWQVQVTQSGKDLKKCLKLIEKGQQYLTHPYPMISERKFISAEFTLNLSLRNIYSRYLYDLHTPEYFYDKALRAPPLS